MTHFQIHPRDHQRKHSDQISRVLNRKCGLQIWLVVLGFKTTLTAKVTSWWSVTHYVFPGFLTPLLTQLFFPKPLTTFLTCFCRGERRKYAGKNSRLNRGSNSQPPGHESDTLNTEPPGWGVASRTYRKLF